MSTSLFGTVDPLLGSFGEEAQAVWDFVRCQRPDGSFYGSPSDNCLKGVESNERYEDKGDVENRLKKINDRQKSAVSRMTQEDMYAIQDYTYEDKESSGSYFKMNECLRRKTPCLSPEIRKNARKLDSALNKLPSNEDGDPFYRGIPVRSDKTKKLFETLKSSKPGDKITDQGFGSYSADEKVTKGFQKEEGGSILFINRSKSLRPVNQFAHFSDEYEAILPRGVTSTIRRITEDSKGNLIVELD